MTRFIWPDDDYYDRPYPPREPLWPLVLMFAVFLYGLYRWLS